MRTRKQELISDELKPFIGKLIKENGLLLAWEQPIILCFAKIISLRVPSRQTPNPSLPNEPFGFRRQ